MKTGYKFVIKDSKDLAPAYRWHWHLVSARNGRVMCQGESHDSASKCRRAIERIATVLGVDPTTLTIEVQK